ncbi:tRNA adenylyltransferase PWA37_004920 [Arxiozyma heterogenica]|uniref:tRNA adenylyltransferase n=1 Tax=Arxiozyma heterogenica TaxID=278026 RepID=UPI002EE60E62
MFSRSFVNFGSSIGVLTNSYKPRIYRIITTTTTTRENRRTITMSEPSQHYKVAERIVLSETESKICDLLKDYCNYYNNTNNSAASNEALVLRITGGWVRDKLLGQGSHDLDIAINKMSGELFAHGLNDYLRQNYSKYGIKPHSIHKIDKNPEKSKHLETATTKLFGIEVDFVNLRSEEYTELSRIPIVNFGTPEQDALRRDATLNALFYNIQTDSIEDFTGKGLSDLKNGILRTPLPPKQTFLDDPLRVLRLIRFASRFNFKIDRNVLKEMSDPEINKSFNSKISRERIGVEMEKILSGPNPLTAWKLIQISNLENVIFFWHCNESVIEFNKRQNFSNVDKIEKVYRSGLLNKHMSRFNSQYPAFIEDVLKSNPSLQNKLLTDKQLRQNFMLGSSLLPFHDMNIIAFPQKKLNNTAPVIECIIKDGLKMSKNDAAVVSQVAQSISKYSYIVTLFNTNIGSTNSASVLKRSQIGLFIRSFKGNWMLVHLVALFNDLLNSDGLQKINPTIIQEYDSFYNMILQENLQDCHSLRPLIDGKSLQKILNMKPGPWMGNINDKQIEWQFDNPTGTKEQLIKYIQRILSNCI